MVNIMGMFFPESEVPNFGTIRLTSSNAKDKKDYILESVDLDKLSLITNAGQGSMAFCTDTKKMYIKHLDKWVEV